MFAEEVDVPGDQPRAIRIVAAASVASPACPAGARAGGSALRRPGRGPLGASRCPPASRSPSLLPPCAVTSGASWGAEVALAATVLTSRGLGRGSSRGRPGVLCSRSGAAVGPVPARSVEYVGCCVLRGAVGFAPTGELRLTSHSGERLGRVFVTAGPGVSLPAAWPFTFYLLTTLVPLRSASPRTATFSRGAGAAALTSSPSSRRHRLLGLLAAELAANAPAGLRACSRPCVCCGLRYEQQARRAAAGDVSTRSWPARQERAGPARRTVRHRGARRRGPDVRRARRSRCCFRAARTD